MITLFESAVKYVGFKISASPYSCFGNLQHTWWTSFSFPLNKPPVLGFKLSQIEHLLNLKLNCTKCG